MNTDHPRPIVCCTDFSEEASAACLAAAALSFYWEKPLILVHVLNTCLVAAHLPGGPEAARQEAQARLDKEKRRVGGAGIPISTKLILDSLPVEAITAFVKEQSADLVVVSAAEKTTADRWLLGSVSESITQCIPNATLVIRSAAPFDWWLSGAKHLKVFVAADFSASSEAALQWVAKLRQLGPCDITVGYVDSPEEERKRLGVPDAPNFRDNPPSVQQHLEQDLAEKVATILGTNEARIWVRGNCGQPDAHLLELARASEADLLVVGSHQFHGLERALHGSTSRNLLRHASMSVACIPTKTRSTAARAIRPCRRVLATVDLTPSGNLALSNAYSIVNEGGTVHLLHVARSQPQADIADKMHAMIPAEAAARGIKTEVEVLPPAEVVTAICAAAERLNADAVCVGAHGRPGIAADILGSVALGVLQRCRRPVMVVWPPTA